MFDPVAEAKNVLSELSWSEKVRIERLRLGRALTLVELLDLAQTHTLTKEDIADQGESWARQDKD